jgi:hypothetical protein
MAMIVLSSPATVTRAEEKKTGPSRFKPLFFDRFNRIIKIQEGRGARASNRRTISVVSHPFMHAERQKGTINFQMRTFLPWHSFPALVRRLNRHLNI